jgi:hypothetical protein
MEAYLQAKDLDVCRVTDEGMRNGTKKEKQFDVIVLTVDFGTPSYKFTVNICTYLIF